MLTWRTLLSYGFGHAFNDLCAAMWFTYFMIFFRYVLEFSSIVAGIALLIGQLADAGSTPIIGLISDRTFCKLFKYYGRRKSWHLIGTLIVTATFPFIFTRNMIGTNLSILPLVMYYAVFIILFQTGWSCVQISHLSLAPELASSEKDRTSLMAIRYAVTILSNIFVYLLMFTVFQNRDLNTQVGKTDRDKFHLVSIIIVTIGVVTSLIYHVGTKERCPSREDATRKEEKLSPTNGNSTRLSLVTNSRIYHTMSIYLMTQLFLNSSLVMIPLYLQTFLKMKAQQLAILPLVMYVGSFITTVIIKRLNDSHGRKQSFFIGGPFVLLACIGVYFGSGTVYKNYLIYGIVSMFGVAGSIMSVTSLGITSDIVYDDTRNGAFIYSIMTFFDKILSGVVVMIVQYVESCWGDYTYYRNVLCFTSAGCIILGTISVYFFKPKSADTTTTTSTTDNKSTDSAGGAETGN